MLPGDAIRYVPGSSSPRSTIVAFRTAISMLIAFASPLSLSGFFAKLYRAYDLRFVYAAPKLEPVTSRWVWDESSPALSDPRAKDYTPRVGEE